MRFCRIRCSRPNNMPNGLPYSRKVEPAGFLCRVVELPCYPTHPERGLGAQPSREGSRDFGEIPSQGGDFPSEFLNSSARKAVLP